MYAPHVTAANHIFHTRYHCMIPRSFMYGERYMAKVGYGTSGCDMVDRMQVNSLVNMHQTIAGLATLYGQGAEPLLHDEADAIPIYDAIVRHLNDWRDFSSQGLNPDYCPPIADFITLENLAIYYHFTVQRIRPTAQSASRLRDSLMNMNRAVYRTSVKAVAEEEVLPFDSIVQDIEANLYGD